MWMRSRMNGKCRVSWQLQFQGFHFGIREIILKKQTKIKISNIVCCKQTGIYQFYVSLPVTASNFFSTGRMEMTKESKIIQTVQTFQFFCSKAHALHSLSVFERFKQQMSNAQKRRKIVGLFFWTHFPFSLVIRHSSLKSLENRQTMQELFTKKIEKFEWLIFVILVISIRLLKKLEGVAGRET